ncbi:MAG: creatininase family protein [Acidobacteria bacterium]|nr:creatininase family protein [Acidobacteriota bacterium]
MTKRLLVAVLFSVALRPIAHAQISKGQGVEGMNVDKVVELELLTQTELADKIRNGWTSVLLATGGTEIRGPHATIGVHNVLATHRAVEAARRLGKTIVAPTIPFAVSATGGPNANQWRAFADGTGVTAPNPGAMQVDAVTFKGILQGTVESLLYIGFKDVFLMGDHGGGQNEMRAVSEEMSAQFAARGIRVHYVGDFYQKTHDDIDMYMFVHKFPIAGHGGMMETAEMMYWEPSQYTFIRPTYKTVPFDGARFEGATRDADLKAWKDAKDARAAGGTGAQGARGAQGAQGAGAQGARGAGAAAGSQTTRVNNGLSGNPHFATKAIGKDLAEIGVTNTVNQVRALLAAPKSASTTAAASTASSQSAAAPAAAPTNPRFGAWKLKPATPPAEGDRSSNIMTYAPWNGTGMSVKIETTNRAGEPGTPWGYNTMLDGKDLPVTGRQGTDTASVAVLNDKINVIIYKQGTRLVQVLQNVLSADGNTINVSYTSTTAAGETRTTYAVYERIAK